MADLRTFDGSSPAADAAAVDPLSIVTATVHSIADPDVLKVIVPSFADDLVFELDSFSPELVDGDEILIGFDESGQPWQIASPAGGSGTITTPNPLILDGVEITGYPDGLEIEIAGARRGFWYTDPSGSGLSIYSGETGGGYGYSELSLMDATGVPHWGVGHEMPTGNFYVWDSDAGEYVLSIDTAGAVNFYRPLILDQYLWASADVVGNLGTNQVALNASGGVPKVLFGSAGDTALWRSSADVLQTDDTFSVSSGSTAVILYPNGAGILQVNAAGNAILRNFLAYGDAQAAFSVFGHGYHAWGAGGSSSPDVNLYRSGVGILSTDSYFTSVVALVGGYGTAGDTRIGPVGPSSQGGLKIAGDTTLYRSAANVLSGGNIRAEGYLMSLNAGGNVAFYAWITGEANPRFYVDQGGIQNWGGGAGGADVNLYRAAANTLRTNGAFQADGNIDADVDGSGRLYMGDTFALDGVHRAGIYFGGPLDTSLYRSTTNTLVTPGYFAALIAAQVGSNAPQSGAILSAVQAGNGIEFGHNNTAGYRSQLGAENSNGYPFLAFSAEHGTNNNTYRTRGNKGTVIRGDVAGGLQIGTLANANADNQSFAPILSIDAAGVLTLTSDLAVTEGGTGASSAAGARTNLGVPTITRGTTFPSSPADGDIHFYPADGITSTPSGAGTGVVWQFIFESTDGDWYFAGGHPAIIYDGDVRVTGAVTTYADLPTDPMSLTLPALAGDWLIEISATIQAPGGGFETNYLSYAIGATAASDAWATTSSFINATCVPRTYRHTGIAASAVIAEKARRSNTANGNNFFNRQIKVWPHKHTP